MQSIFRSKSFRPSDFWKHRKWCQVADNETWILNYLASGFLVKNTCMKHSFPREMKLKAWKLISFMFHNHLLNTPAQIDDGNSMKSQEYCDLWFSIFSQLKRMLFYHQCHKLRLVLYSPLFKFAYSKASTCLQIHRPRMWVVALEIIINLRRFPRDLYIYIYDIRTARINSITSKPNGYTMENTRLSLSWFSQNPQQKIHSKSKAAMRGRWRRIIILTVPFGGVKIDIRTEQKWLDPGWNRMWRWYCTRR